MRSKIKKFEENLQRSNIIEPGKELYDTIKGNWKKLYFKNNHPITLELACGGGEYTVGLSKLFPNRNFIGIDIKGDRIITTRYFANFINRIAIEISISR